jgi:hypothetical protein
MIDYAPQFRMPSQQLAVTADGKTFFTEPAAGSSTVQ